MPQFRLFCYSMLLSASGKGSGLHSLKADLLNGLVENSQIDAVRRAASSETKGSALHRDFIMITKNPMQLKAYIKKKATEKHILHSL